MAIAFKEQKSGGAINAGAITLTFTANTDANDLVIVVHGDGDTTDNTLNMTTSGYTLLGSEQYANGTSNDTNMAVHYKVSPGGEANVTVAGTGGGSNAGASAACYVFTGCHTTTPILSSGFATGTGSTSADPPSLATTGGHAVVIAGNAANATIGTWTAPTNYTTDANLGTAGADTIDSRCCMGFRLSGFADPENPGAFTNSATGAGDSWAAATILLQEAPAAVPFPVFHVPDRSIYPGPTDA